MHRPQRVEASGQVVQYNSGTLRNSFQLPHRRRLDDIEDTKKYKSREKRLPCERHGDESYELTSDLINHDKLRIFYPAPPRCLRRRRNTDERDQHGQADRNRRSQRWRKRVCQPGPQ